MVNSLNNVISGRLPQTTSGRGYQSDSLREVKTRAALTDQKQSNEERNSLRRLNSVLSKDQPLRQDVPRGYYLNITV